MPAPAADEPGFLIVDYRLDEDHCRMLLEGMELMDEMLRRSGQYGARVPVPDGAVAQSFQLGKPVARRRGGTLRT